MSNHKSAEKPRINSQSKSNDQDIGMMGKSQSLKSLEKNGNSNIKKDSAYNLIK